MSVTPENGKFDVDGLLREARQSMANFDVNAILRALRALQNPGLFKYDHYRQAALAVCAGIVIRLLVAAPIVGIKVLLWTLSFVVNFEQATWDDQLVGGLDFIANSVLQVPFFLMSLMRYITPTLDEMFMDSLQWVDQTYTQKHKADDPNTLRAMYYPNLRLYPTHGDTSKHHAPMEAAFAFLKRYGRRAGISLAIYLLSYLPLVGRFVLPAASFWTFNRAVGPVPATVIFGAGVLVPRRWLVVFLQSYFSSRALMRELVSDEAKRSFPFVRIPSAELATTFILVGNFLMLEPYFSRIRFTKEQKRRWFRDREGLLFGFGVGFYIFLRIPLLGVLVYGIAEASTAYLITKITDPPPPPTPSDQFAESQVRWKNKHEFLRLPLDHLDVPNMPREEKAVQPQELRGKKYT